MAPEIELLHAVENQPFEACEAEWTELLRSLHLGLSYVPAVQAVIQERRWKTQPNPIAYVRKSSVRCAVRMGIVDRRPKHREILASELHIKDADGKSLGHDDKLGTALHRYDQQFGSGPGATHEAIYDEDYIGNRLPESVMDENLEVEWDRVAQLAGMDAGERIVLKLRLSGLERDTALAACYTDADRKILQAAWKRFDRHKDLFKEVLLSGRPLSNRRSPGSHPARPVHEGSRVLKARQENRVDQVDSGRDTPGATPQLEMILIELPQGGMKISFRRCLP
jgi:hypothetical protein